MASWGVPYEWFIEEEKTRSWFKNVSISYILLSPSGQLQHYSPFWDIPEGHWWRKIFIVCRTSGNELGCTFHLEGKMIKCATIYWCTDCSQGLAGYLGIWSNMIGKLVTKTFGEEVCGWISPIGEVCEDICEPCKFSEKGDFNREEP